MKRNSTKCSIKRQSIWYQNVNNPLRIQLSVRSIKNRNQISIRISFCVPIILESPLASSETFTVAHSRREKYFICKRSAMWRKQIIFREHCDQRIFPPTNVRHTRTNKIKIKEDELQCIFRFSIFVVTRTQLTHPSVRWQETFKTRRKLKVKENLVAYTKKRKRNVKWKRL